MVKTSWNIPHGILVFRMLLSDIQQCVCAHERHMGEVMTHFVVEEWNFVPDLIRWNVMCCCLWLKNELWYKRRLPGK